MSKILYYVEPTDSFQAEGRIFYEGERYPVFRKKDDYVVLVAENGDFCFSESLMDQAYYEWGLIRYYVGGEVVDE